MIVTAIAEKKASKTRGIIPRAVVDAAIATRLVVDQLGIDSLIEEFASAGQLGLQEICVGLRLVDCLLVVARVELREQVPFLQAVAFDDGVFDDAPLDFEAHS
jgi:hypothetical protein